MLGQKPGEAVESVKQSASSAADTASKKTEEVKDSAGKTVEDAKKTDVSKKVRIEQTKPSSGPVLCLR